MNEINEKIPLSLNNDYTLKRLDRGTLILEISANSQEDFSRWTDILSNCITIELLRIELESREIPPQIQKRSKNPKPARSIFLEGCFENALTRLVQVISPPSIELITNIRYWKEFSQQEVQGIFKRVAKQHDPPITTVLKKAESKFHIALTKQHLKITMDIPAQEFFSHIKIHQTPVFSSVAHVMVHLALEQVPEGSRFLDAMCGAGTVAFITAKLLSQNEKIHSSPPSIAGFDIDPIWIEVARENAEVLNLSDISFFEWDILSNDLESFPFNDCDVILSHPPYGYFVQYTPEKLKKIYSNLLRLFIVHGSKSGCLVINTPREDILIPLIEKSPLTLVKTLDIPRKKTIVKLWVLMNKTE